MGSRAATGRRVSLQINPNLASEVARSAVVRSGLERVVDRIADLADSTCPIGTEDEHLPPGHDPETLKNSERRGVIETPTGALGVVAYMAWWAHMTHNGTVHSHPNPWLLNAALSILVKGSVT